MTLGKRYFRASMVVMRSAGTWVRLVSSYTVHRLRVSGSVWRAANPPAGPASNHHIARRRPALRGQSQRAGAAAAEEVVHHHRLRAALVDCHRRLVRVITRPAANRT